MSKPTTIEREVARFRRDIDRAMRERVREAIEVILDEELTEALGCPRHDRTEDRLGYRNGSIERDVTMETGLQRLRVPRGRIDKDDGSFLLMRSGSILNYRCKPPLIHSSGSRYLGTFDQRTRNGSQQF